MSNPLQVCLYNTQPEFSQELREQIDALSFVRFIGDVDDPDNLISLLQEAEVNIILFHLDPNPSSVIEVIDRISAQYAEVALIAVSHQTDPEAILTSIRAGCDQYVCEPIDQHDLVSAINQVAKKRFLHSAKSLCICVTAASGGMGTTSIACNLALELGQLTESQCALADLNLQFGDAAINFDCEPKYTFFDLADSAAQLDRAMLVDAMTTLPCNVSLLPRPAAVEQQEAITPEMLHRVIQVLNRAYENVVIDLPRNLDAHTLAVLSQADVILIVCQLLIPSIRNAKRYYDALCRAGIVEERIQIVINRTTKNSGRISEKDVQDTIGKPVYARVPNDFEFIARSLDFGRPIASLDLNNPVRKAIREMAAKVANIDGGGNDSGRSKKGLLGRFLSKTAKG